MRLFMDEQEKMNTSKDHDLPPRKKVVRRRKRSDSIESYENLVYCPECKEYKPRDDFYRNTSRPTFYDPIGRSTYCKLCSKAKNKGYSNKELSAKKRKIRRLINQYNVTEEDYNKLFESQSGKCKICGIHQSQLDVALAVDHNHETGKVRGLLCRKCNTGIAMFGDEAKILYLAGDYLNDYQ